jgi:hypothetical protein
VVPRRTRTCELLTAGEAHGALPFQTLMKKSFRERRELLHKSFQPVRASSPRAPWPPA